MNWTDQDVDNLLASVEETLVKVDVLAKSASLKKDEDPNKKPEDAAAPAAPPADAAPAADAGAAPMDAAPAADAGAAPAADAGAPPADAAAAAPGAEGDQALAGEQGEDAPLSDEELSQIYSSMAPDELERHYSIIRQALQASYSQDQGQADQAGAPAPGAEAAPAAPGAGAPPDMNKSEDKAVIEKLTKQVGEQAQAIEQITKAFEVLTKPSRKSITDIQVMHKSEFDAPPADGSQPMTKDQVKEGARKLNPAKLEKGERDQMNKFFITGEGQAEIEKLIHSKGGK